MTMVKVRRSMHRIDHLVDDVFVDVTAPIIDDQLVDEETKTFISEDHGDGIEPINVPLEGKDVPPPPVQPLLEPKEKVIILMNCITLQSDFSNNTNNIEL